MFGLNKYLLLGLGIVFAIMAGALYFFYDQSQDRLKEVVRLEGEVTILKTSIENKENEISLWKSKNEIQEKLLKENREELEKKREELSVIEEGLSSEIGITDEAHPSLKKLFEKMKERK